MFAVGVFRSGRVYNIVVRSDEAEEEGDYHRENEAEYDGGNEGSGLELEGY